MSKLECYIVRDLLPLFIDHACSEPTARDVAAHLESCAECKKLCDKMSSDCCPTPRTPEYESGKILRHARKTLLGIIVALAAMISCFVINANGAWAGDPAGLGNLAVTVLYLVFWGVFSFLSRGYAPLLNTSFVVSLLTFIASIMGLIASASDNAGFVTAFVVGLSAIPFYGFRLFLEWPYLYAAATALSLCWLIYTGRKKHSLAYTST